MSLLQRLPAKLLFPSSLLLAGVFNLLMVFFPWAGFETNDDALMMHISAGSLSGEGSPYLVYSHIYLGNMLVWLYGQFPGINFYPIYLYTAHWLSLSALLYFCAHFHGRMILLFCLFFLLPVEMLMLCNLQFTSASIMVAFAGLMIVLLALRKKSVPLLLFAAVLFIISLLIRWESFILVSILGFFPLAFEFYHNRWKTFLLFLSLFILAAFGLRQIHESAYAFGVGETVMNPETEQQMRFIMDFPQRVSETDLEKAGWSINDYKLCRQWFWADSEFYHWENFKKLSNTIVFDLSPQGKLMSLLHFIYSCCGFMAAFFLVFYLFRNASSKRQMAVWIVPLLVLLAGLFLLERIVPRVVIPALTCILMVIVAEAGQIKGRYPNIFFGLSSALILFQIYLSADKNLSSRADFEKSIAVLNKYPDHLIINKDSWVNLEGCPLWEDPRRYSKGNLFWIDVLAGYPVYNDMLKKREIGNLMKAVWNKPDVMVMADQVDDIIIYAAEHYNEEIGQTVVEHDVNRGVHLFHLWKKNNW